MATKEKPRKLTAENEQELSVDQLLDIPLKKRLEILFAANIIPSRRQLALKYQLPENLIHNVLSHRKYLLENWKYNVEPTTLLSKSDLENAIAMTELLIEWKRRVQLSGLQITDAALTRKAIYLQRVLNGSASGDLSEKWWQHFDINWEYKQFHDYESDSLEMEDILNDLHWMFSEHSFRRLLMKFRQAKHGNKRQDQFSNANKYEEIEDFLDISDIKAEPHYYNDDDFDCEDYEFVLDEENVIEALRKELEDSEQSKYQQYLLGSIIDNDDTASQAEFQQDCQAACHEESQSEEESFKEVMQAIQERSYIDENFVGSSSQDDVNSDEQQKVNTENVNEETPPMEVLADSNAAISKRAEPRNTEEDATLVVVASTTTATTTTTPVALVPMKPAPFKRKTRNLPGVPSLTATTTTTPVVLVPMKPAPFKRKPRNLHGVLSLRKDHVRMPAVADVAKLAKKERLEQLAQISGESDDNEDTEKQQKTRKRRNGHVKAKLNLAQSQSSKAKTKRNATHTTTQSFTPKEYNTADLLEESNNAAPLLPQTDLVAQHVFSLDDSFDDVKQELSSPTLSDSDEYITDGISTRAAMQPKSSNFEQNNNNTEKLSNKMPYRSSRRSTRRITTRSTGKSNNATENEQNDDDNIGYKSKAEVDIEAEKAVFDASPTAAAASITGKRRGRQPKNNSNNKYKSNKPAVRTSFIKIPMKRVQNSSIPTINAQKRVKRRTDGADLTLRKDKVRLNVVPLASNKNSAASYHCQNTSTVQTSNEADVQMVFEPYTGEV